MLLYKDIALLKELYCCSVTIIMFPRSYMAVTGCYYSSDCYFRLQYLVFRSGSCGFPILVLFRGIIKCSGSSSVPSLRNFLRGASMLNFFSLCSQLLIVSNLQSNEPRGCSTLPCRICIHAGLPHLFDLILATHPCRPAYTQMLRQPSQLTAQSIQMLHKPLHLTAPFLQMPPTPRRHHSLFLAYPSNHGNGCRSRHQC